MSPRRSIRSMPPANRLRSCRPSRRLPRSTGRLANERDRTASRRAADQPFAGGGKALRFVGAAVRGGDPGLAVCLAVLSALSVSVADRRVLALPADFLRWIDVLR